MAAHRRHMTVVRVGASTGKIEFVEGTFPPQHRFDAIHLGEVNPMNAG